MKTKTTVLYEGSDYCAVGPCPRVEYITSKDMIRISDPLKPERGVFVMSGGEYDTLLKHAKSTTKKL